MNTVIHERTSILPHLSFIIWHAIHHITSSLSVSHHNCPQSTENALANVQLDSDYHFNLNQNEPTVNVFLMMNDDNLITRKMYKLNTKRATNHPSLVEDKRELWATALVIPPLVQQRKQCLSDWHPISISTFHQCRDPLFIVFVILVEVRKDVLLFLLWITFIEFRETGGHKNYSQHHHLYLDFFCLLLSNPVCVELKNVLLQLYPPQP